MKNNFFLRFVALIASLFVFIGLNPVIIGVHAEDAHFYEGDMNFDVIFVADGSGSMNYSDDKRLTAQAINMFIDMMDNTCRAGYVVYSHELVSKSEEGLISVSDEKMTIMQSNIKEIEYRHDADTDISLGLTEAMGMHEQCAGQAGRKPIIVLLSDGNTDLPKGPRTEEESAAELESTLSTLAGSGIKVYTIGLNCNGSLDTDTMKRISDTTNAFSFETDSADELQNIINQIFADCSNITSIPVPVDEDEIEETNGAGEKLSDYTAEVNVKNNSVYLANVVIQSKRGLSNPRVYNPYGQEVSIDDHPNIIVKESENYTIIKLFNPEVGVWKVVVRGLTEDEVSINLLESYDFYVEQTLDNKNAMENTDITVNASLFQKDGLIEDEDLLTSVKAVCTVTGESGSEDITLEYKNNGIFSGKYHINNVGTYKFKTSIGAMDGSFSKESKSMAVTAENTWNKSVINQILSENEIVEKESFNVKAMMYAGEKMINDSLQLSGYSVKCVMTNSNNESFTYPMKETDGVFSVDIIPPASEAYKICTIFEDNSTGDVKSSNSDNISVTKLPLTLNKSNVSVSVRSKPRQTSEDILLNQFFSASASDSITIKNNADGEYFEVESSGNQLTISGVKPGSDSFDVIISNERGEEISFSVKVDVENGWKLYIGIGCGVAGILILIYIIYLIIRPKLNKNSISMSINIPLSMSMGVPARQNLSLPKLHSSTLYNVMYLVSNSFAFESFKEYINKLGLVSILKNVKLVAIGRRKIKVIVNGSEKNQYIVNTEQVASKTSLIIGEGGSDRLDIKLDNGSHVVIEYVRN